MTEVFIAGLGLIGSSLARALRQRRSDVTVTGFDAASASLDWATAHQVIDRRADSLAAAASADIIILATPVTQIERDLAFLATIKLKPGVIVTDTGSVKTSVLHAATALMTAGVTFVGGHPMAGSEKSGVQAGRAGLFAEHQYFLVNGNATPAQIQALRNILAAAGTYFTVLTAPEHDALVGHISHVPHVAAAALTLNAASGLSNQPEHLQFAAGGFRDTTRIAASDPQMWTAIMESNAAVITAELATYIAQLQNIKAAIEQREIPAIEEFFAAAKRVRQSIDRKE